MEVKHLSMALVTDCCTVSEISCRFGGMVFDTCFITSSARYSRSFWKASFAGTDRSDRGLRYGADSVSSTTIRFVKGSRFREYWCFVCMRYAIRKAGVLCRGPCRKV